MGIGLGFLNCQARDGRQLPVDLTCFFRRIGQQHGDLRIGEYVFLPFEGIVRICGDIGCARFQNGDHSRNHGHVPVCNQPYPVTRPNSRGHEAPRQPVGLSV